MEPKPKPKPKPAWKTDEPQQTRRMCKHSGTWPCPRC